ncbi:Lrp/AsnC family transcriptional regulator [Candidatus Bathyarchaeota archaeon]|nr:Lrp/AsnC family transcriptional regulator [Candidatus Bathyarchaeota archaeon]
MDAVDEKILKLLKENGRMTYVEIGEQVGLSEGAIRNRVQSLINNGIIKKFTIEIATTTKVRSLTMISVDPSTPTYTVSKEVQKLSGVERIYEVTGEYDIVTVVSHTSIEGINQCIEEIRKIKGVVKTNSIIVLRTVNI